MCPLKNLRAQMYLRANCLVPEVRSGWSYACRKGAVLWPLMAAVCIFVLYYVGVVLHANSRGWESFSGNPFNRFSMVLMVVVSLPHLANMINYYRGRFDWCDGMLLAFIFLYLVGRHEPAFWNITNVLRIVVCFYFIPYFVAQGRVLVKYLTPALTLIGLYGLWCLSHMPTNSGQRFEIYGSATNGIRGFYAIFALCLLCYSAVGLFFLRSRILALLAGIAMVPFMLLTGSRASLVALGVSIIGFELFHRSSLKATVVFLYKYAAAIAIGMLTFVMLAGATFDWDRLADFTAEGVLHRSVRYSYYLDLLREHLPGSLLSGVSLDFEFIMVDGIRVNPAPHNMFLAMGLQAGILCSFVYLLWHVMLFRRMLAYHKRTAQRSLSATAITICLVAIMIGQWENYFPAVSSPLVYLFYIISGVYCNQQRRVRGAGASLIGYTRYRTNKTPLHMPLPGYQSS